MLQIAIIEKKLQQCSERLEKRGIINAKQLLDNLLLVNEKRKHIQQDLDRILHEGNILTKQIGELYKQGKKKEAEQIRQKSINIKLPSKKLTESLNIIEKELEELLYHLPNIPNESVPQGKSEQDNLVIKESLKHLPNTEETKKPHWELIEEYKIIDFELGNKVSGAGFPFYVGQGARLSRGLINFFLDSAIQVGYREVQPPLLINKHSGLGTGQLPDKEGQMYQMKEDELYLIPTAEVPITNMYRDTVLEEQHLPIKEVSYTPCFRREAGSWGAHVRGLNRLHQFDKVEIVEVVNPENSYQELNRMVAYVENLIKSLELPYRILKLCTGELGVAAAMTYDFEVFSAAQKRWLEVSSVSNFETYQSNRIKLRIKDSEGKKHLAHTLNGSALALPRIMAALLENNQNNKGILLPKVLWDYVGTEMITRS